MLLQSDFSISIFLSSLKSHLNAFDGSIFVEVMGVFVQTTVIANYK